MENDADVVARQLINLSLHAKHTLPMILLYR